MRAPSPWFWVALALLCVCLWQASQLPAPECEEAFDDTTETVRV